MDALKKAEEEKKQAAKRLQDVEMEARESTSENEVLQEQNNTEVENSTPELFTETAQFSLEPLSLEEKLEEIKTDETDDDIVLEPTDASENFSEDLTLENTIAEAVEPQEAFEETQKAIDLNDTTIIEGLSTENAAAPFDDTFHGVLFEDDDQETDFYEETLPGVPADQLAKDLGGGKYQPTPVAAKTVFSAGAKSNKKQGSFKWGILVVLALLAICSFSIFYYFTITPVSRTLPSPLIAKGIESNGFEPTIIPQKFDTHARGEMDAGLQINDNFVEPADNVEEASEVTPLDITTNEAIVSVEDKELSKSAIETLEAEAIVKENSETSIDETNSNTLQKNDELSENKTNESLNPERVSQNDETKFYENKIDPALINISKSKKQAKVGVMVSNAYKAYQDGHLDAAKSIYEGVLKNDPDNRDAHLGLGAIAISREDKSSAYAHYLHLLDLNPLDAIAMNALIGLSNSADPIKDESAIKLLIKKDDAVPALYFSLGNLYAKQKRWASAQQAFFNAYRLDSSNPNYLINLAISLDQMGQYKTALNYYETAINLTDFSSAKFNTLQVKDRINALSKLVESKQ